MQDITGQLKDLHAAYTRLTGMEVELTMQRMFSWQAYIAKGFTADDLALVVSLLKAKIKAKQKWPSCLLFRNLIQNLEFYEEDLSEARALSRRPKPSPRQMVLAATGRCEPEPTSVRTPAQVMDSAKAFAAFKAWRQENGI